MVKKENIRKDKKTIPDYIICIGASAGGLEAIESFFKHMPSDSGAAFVVIQHLSPDYKSMMVELLSKKTNMEVIRAENNLEVSANKIYLITPKKNLKIFHGKLLLQDQVLHKGVNLPIDVFMKSLAEDAAEKSIGIILSGTGSDGMRGVRAIKESGGMIMVQSEDSAKFDGMPRSAVSTGLADYILAPEEMPSQLIAFMNHLRINQKSNVDKLVSDEDNLFRIFSLIREKHSVDFSFYKKTTILRRLERRMTINHIDGLKEYVKFIENNSREIDNLYQEFLIGVTSFFRDEEAFKLLNNKYIPEIISRCRNKEIRFWVAGCSTGEEAYSLAIICRECMEKLQLQVDIKIFATDVDSQAIIKASSGVYPYSIASDVGQQLLTKYFIARGEEFQVVRSIREMVVFAQHNIIKDPPFNNIELVSCRNLLIYLQPVMQQKVLNLLNFSLNHGGILFLGSSESTGELVEYFEPLSHKWKLFRSKGQSRTVHTVQKFQYNKPENTYNYYHSEGGRYYAAQSEVRLFERLLDTLKSECLPLTILVNEKNEILRIIGNAASFIKLPRGKMLNDITRMAVPELTIPLATGLQKVFKKGEQVNYTNILLQQDNQKLRIDLKIRQVQEKKGQPPYALIFINELEKLEQPASKEINYDIDKDAQQRIRDLEQELQFTRENLQATIEELETSNEELQATNEELLASNEELQSTNEELQSVNEELHTVNAEYQLKITELAELNNDIENLLKSIDIGTIFLDENLEIRKYTPQIKEVFKLDEKDIGREIEDIRHNLQNFALLDKIKLVQETNHPLERHARDKEDKWYIIRILPYYITPEVSSGIVITCININEIEQLRSTLSKKEEWLATAAKLTRMGYWEIDKETGKTTWSDAVYEIHEVDKNFDHDVENGLNFYHAEDRVKISKAVEEAMELGKSFDLELRFVSASGKNLWVRSIGMAEVEHDEVKRVYGAFQDITEYKKLKIAEHKRQHKK